MANNRLFIGNKDTLQFTCISKCNGVTWGDIGLRELDAINKVLTTDSTWESQSNLIFFTEVDDVIYNLFHSNMDNYIK